MKPKTTIPPLDRAVIHGICTLRGTRLKQRTVFTSPLCPQSITHPAAKEPTTATQRHCYTEATNNLPILLGGRIHYSDRYITPAVQQNPAPSTTNPQGSGWASCTRLFSKMPRQKLPRSRGKRCQVSLTFLKAFTCGSPSLYRRIAGLFSAVNISASS